MSLLKLKGGNMMGIVAGREKQVGDASMRIDEYAQRIAQEIEKERNKAKELAEQEAGQIIAKAYQESDDMIGRAQTEAEHVVVDHHGVELPPPHFLDRPLKTIVERR